MKAITPVIALVMLMLITVGSAGMAYAWFSNMMIGQTEKNIAIPVGGVQCINNRVSVIVTNTGANSNITDDDIVVADINGVSVRNTPFFGGFNLNGLVGYWRFEQSSGSAATNDSSGYGNMGTLTNMNLVGDATSGPTTNGRFGNALLFDGVNDYVDAGSGASLNIRDRITVEMWVKPDSLPWQESSFYARGNTYSFLMGLWAYQPAVYQSCDGGTWNSVAATSDSILIIGKWSHIAATYDASTGITKVYGNGKLQGSGTGTACQITSSTPTFIGARSGGSVGFDGVIDEVGVWSRALTPDEITQLNKTNAGNFTIAPQKAITLINGYPVFAKGRYTVRVGTRNGVIERTVECM